jgi:hypothetical protein
MEIEDKPEKPRGEFGNDKSMYFNDYLSSHVGHKMEVVEYLCGVCRKTSDYMLRCIQEEVDGTCFDDAAGIAREWILPECGCKLRDWKPEPKPE